jgi:alkyldihydroxyacetonephosphate synthase
MTIDRTKLRWNGWGWAAHKDEVGAREAVWTWLASELGMPALLATPPQPLAENALPLARLGNEVWRELGDIVGADRVHDDAYERAFHARGRSYHDLLRLRAGDFSAIPDAVVYPRATEEVLRLLKLAEARGFAIVPYGGGTSVVGGVTAEKGAHAAVVTLDLSGMNRLIDVDMTAHTATAEAGIYGPALEKALEAKGATLGHHPQSFEFSTLGGWIAHRGAGQGSSGYGRAEDWLVSVKLATPRGLLSTGDTPSSSAGPQLKDIVLGSEGAFGIVTEATVRVRPLPREQDYRGYLFHDFESGAKAIRRAVQQGVPATMLRLSDAEETRFFRAYSAAGKRPGLSSRAAEMYLNVRSFDDSKACALIAGFEGDPGTVASGRRAFDWIAKSHGAMALGTGQGRRWREGRFHGPYLRDPMMDRGLGVDTLETATSWSKLDTLYAAVNTALEEAMRETAPRPGAHGIVLCHISHSYPDGASLYFTYIFPRALGSEVAQWSRIKNAATDAIVKNGGTISHHHGVGEDHLPWMKDEKGELGLEVLRAIKTTLDPKGVLNPGKLIPG